MRASRFSEEQIIAILREQEAGAATAEATAHPSQLRGRWRTCRRMTDASGDTQHSAETRGPTWRRFEPGFSPSANASHR